MLYCVVGIFYFSTMYATLRNDANDDNDVDDGHWKKRRSESEREKEIISIERVSE
jgi:hypothetical protein